MKKQPTAETNPTRTVTVLSVSPLADDHSSLQVVFNARAVIHAREICVVICECDLSPGLWIDMLEEWRPLHGAPPLIVTSRLADERLWAEALNLGAYDVLAKPFERREVVRSVSLAWLHWHHQHQAPAMPTDAMRAAS